MLSDAQPAQRAGILSAVYLISYSSAALPGLAAGAMTRVFSHLQVALIPGAVTLICTVFVLLRPRPARA
ncbi:hypothetical protein PAB09_03740 [Corynebacterium sp. SCR221107]|uniref:hypothetical protein n=1 Tax=Corynebacterium sp. SCR221107 TaxID=3017361 RepID=UPI0022EC4FAD|nr:hypothetical protein [Corynebacterium sp. SCR221107]WBT09445.1 hypothetical protein PAB09_03740 [Corynebacterium sp. SCR221107]